VKGNEMTKTEFRRILDSLADAWTRRDYGRACEVFANDVHYADPLRYQFHSREQLRAFFEDDGGHEQRTTWHTIVFDEERQIGGAEYTYDGTQRYHGIALIKAQDGLITHWREYQHIDDREWEELVGATRF
jgi:hypothetical protein